jgi:outer membrane protein, heavy metal efflux system
MFRNPGIQALGLAFALASVESQAQEARRSDSAVGQRTSSVASNEEPVSLDQILEHAMKGAPAAMLARAGIEAGKAELEAASPLFPRDPVLSGSIGRRKTSSGSGIDYSVGVQQELDLAGKRAAQLRAARLELSARRAELLASQWFVHQQVHGAYHQALVARDRADAARRVLAFAERLVEVARRRLAAGETSPLPLRLAEAELAQAKQGVLLADSEYHRIRLDLARAAGWTKPALLTPTGKLDLPTMPPSSESLIRRARREQPALRAARARLSAARARLSAAKRHAWPNPTVGVVYQNEAEPGTDPARVVSGTLSVPIPLWVGSAPDRARARAGIAEGEARQTALTTSLGAQIVQARQRVEANAKSARVYGAEILPTLETNLGLLQKAFELGEIDIHQVMVAQERFLRTQQDALQAFADYYEAWAELEATVGGELHGFHRTKPAPGGQGRNR